MKKHLIFTLALFLTGWMMMQGQSISICATPSGGGFVSTPSGSMSSSIGQMVYQTAEDPTGGFLTQGFQQPGCNPAGTPCDDGDPCTINEVEDGICGCSGGVPAPNTSPVADAGGPYTISAGSDLQLDGSASFDACGDVITAWEWDLDNNALFNDASGESPLVSWNDLLNVGIATAGIYTIELRVTDGNGASHIAATTVTVIDTTVPTLGQWGLIIFGLLLLCAGAIVIWRREYEPVLAKV